MQTASEPVPNAVEKQHQHTYESTKTTSKKCIDFNVGGTNNANFLAKLMASSTPSPESLKCLKRGTAQVHNCIQQSHTLH